MNAGRASHRLLGLVLVLAWAQGWAGAAPSDREASVLAAIQAREYDLSWQAETPLAGHRGAWQAPNRAQNFRTYFTDAGIRVVPRLVDLVDLVDLEQEPGQPSWEWGLALVRYGRPGTQVTLEASRLTPQGNRLHRDWGTSGLTEWYVNDSRGLKHGFTLAEAPGGAGEVQLDLALSGALHPKVGAGGQVVDFSIPGGTTVLRYAELAVLDARGRELPARMEGFAEAGVRGIRIVFEDRDAAYPVTVDPLATSAVWSNEAQQANARYGFSVSTAGDVNGDGYSDILVGAEGYDNGQADEGRVFLYEGTVDGQMSQGFPNWFAESDQAGAFFGGCVAPAGDVNGDGYGDVIVGARNYDNGQTDEGRVYVYLGSPDGLTFPAVPDWTAEGNQAGALFGTSVATAGDVNNDGYSDVIVGAPSYDNQGLLDQGWAFVYLGSASGLAANAVWITESGQAGALYGVSVSTAGDINGDGYDDVLVGARNYDNGQTDEGIVRLYTGWASGVQFGAAMTFESDQAGANFGRSVATAGDVNGDGYADFLVGAYTYDNGQADEGRVYVYRGASSSVPTLMTTLEADQTAASFGITVGPAGDVNGDGYADVVVGAYLYDNGQSNEGRAFVYQGSAAGLATTPAWTGESDQANAQYGWSVATAGDVNRDGYSDLIVGALFYANGESGEGRAFVYLGVGGVPATTHGTGVESNYQGGSMGVSVASAGDVNGDGYADVIVGGDRVNTHGAAYVYQGSASGIPTSAAWMIDDHNVPTDGGLGNAVAGVGDVNGDGYDDVIVGDRLRTFQQGRADVFLGSAAGLPTSPAWTVVGATTGNQYGASVAGAGDVNGDGYADVLVGAPRLHNGVIQSGRAFLYLGSPTGLSTTPAWSADGASNLALFGTSVASAGDVNNDGYADVIVGAPGQDAGTSGGRAYLYLGSASGLAATPVWSTAAGVASAEFGKSVASAGDVNGDGRADLVIGAPSITNGTGSLGRVYVYHGSFSGVPTFATALDGQATIDAFGFSTAGAGDLNGDGFSDVVVGAHDNGGGRSYVYLGSTAGLGGSPAWNPTPPAAVDLTPGSFGYSVAGAGDVDGDGFPDVIIGAPSSTHGVAQQSEGMAFLYHGNGGRGRNRLVRQLRSNGTTPISIGGRADSQTSFRIKSLGWSAGGRARVRMEWEVQPFPVFFDGSSIVREAAADTGHPSGGGAISFDKLASGVWPDYAFGWRVRATSDNVFFPSSPWVSPAGNHPRSADFRTPVCVDGDGDGYGANGDPTCPAGPQTDCDDGNPNRSPGLAEVCDGLDNNCDTTVDNVPPPVGSPSLFVDTAVSNAFLSWSVVPNATRYDVVRGVLSTLRSSGGNFTSAIDVCGGNDVTDTTAIVAGTPALGDALFYLVRPSAGSCAQGTYNSGAASQSGSRDAEIAASPAACP